MPIPADETGLHLPPNDIAIELDQALSALQKATMAFADVEADSGQTLQLALHQLIEVTGADAGAVAVPGPPGGAVILLAERCLLGAGSVIQSTLQAVLAERSPQAAINEPTAAQRASVSGITSILCTPVRRRGETLAAVYLDRRDKPAFDELALRLATSFASVLGLAFDLTRQREWAEQNADEARAVAVHTSDFWRFGKLVTRNRRFADCLQLAERAAVSDATVLLLGEMGAGKEHLARCIHAESSRRDRPFVVVNCAATSSAMLERELFGHEQRDLTGDDRTLPDAIERAQFGSLLLAEIGELPLQLQAKLGRMLADLRAAPVDRERAGHHDVRIMAAARKNLPHEIHLGRFRKELFDRLNVVAVTLPALRHRLEDLPALARGFAQHEAQRSGRQMSLTDEALRALARHAWPGNIAELQNVIEKLCALSTTREIGLSEVELHIGALAVQDEPALTEAHEGLRARIEDAERAIRELKLTLDAPFEPDASGERPFMPVESEVHQALALLQEMGPKKTFREQMDDAARQVLSSTIRREGSINAAARALGLSRQHVYLKCKRLGLKDL
jgi:transcriptional regulator with PAS, ATPase and Fis domain